MIVDQPVDRSSVGLVERIGLRIVPDRDTKATKILVPCCWKPQLGVGPIQIVRT